MRLGFWFRELGNKIDGRMPHTELPAALGNGNSGVCLRIYSATGGFYSATGGSA